MKIVNNDIYSYYYKDGYVKVYDNSLHLLTLKIFPDITHYAWSYANQQGSFSTESDKVYLVTYNDDLQDYAHIVTTVTDDVYKIKKIELVDNPEGKTIARQLKVKL